MKQLRMLTKRLIAQRYDIVDRTADRWLKNKILPESDERINGRLYWREDKLEQHERARMKASLQSETGTAA